MLIELGKKYVNNKNINSDLKALLLNNLMYTYNFRGRLVYSEALYDILGIDKKFWVLDDIIKVGYKINKIAELDPLLNLNCKNYRLFTALSNIIECMLAIPTQYVTYKYYDLYDSRNNLASTFIKLVDTISNDINDSDIDYNVYLRILRVEMQYLIDTYGTIEIDISDENANMLDINKLVPKEYMDRDHRYMNSELMNMLENFIAICNKNIEINDIMRNTRNVLDLSSSDSVYEVKERIENKSLDIDKTIELLKELQAKLKTL